MAVSNETQDSTRNSSIAVRESNSSFVNFAGSNYFKRFDTSNDVTTIQTEITDPLYVTTDTALTPYTTGSGTTLSSSVVMYYTGATAETLYRVFDALYCVKSGSDPNAHINQQAAYAALQCAILDNPSSSLLLNGAVGTSGSHRAFVIAIPRTYYKSELDQGNWQIDVASGSSVQYFIDNTSAATASIVRAGRRSSIVSGNLTNGPYDTTAVGYCYHDLGLLLFDGYYNPTLISFATNSIFTDAAAPERAVLSGAAFIQSIKGRSSTKLNSISYFCRAFNKEFNYSSNNTFSSPTDGTISVSDFLTNGTKTYVTTIGLYNDANELIAVAKTSQPIQKSFDKEMIIRVRLDF
jgi:hypothetical protein